MATHAAESLPPSPSAEIDASDLLREAIAANEAGDPARGAALAGRVLSRTLRMVGAEALHVRATLCQAHAQLALGQADTALAVLQRLSRKLPPEQEVPLHLALGRTHAARGDANTALAHWSRALDAALAQGGIDACAEACIGIGALYLAHGNADYAFRYHDLAVELASEETLQVRAHVGLGAALIALDQPDMARAALAVAQRRLVLPGHRPWQAQIQFHLGTLAADDAVRAGAHFQSALALHSDTGNLAGQAATLLALGRLAERQGDVDAAEHHLLRAAALSGGLPVAQLVVDVQQALSEHYEARGDDVRATRHYIEFHALYERLHRADRRAATVSGRRLEAIEMRLRLLTSEIELSQLREETDAGRARMAQLEQAAYRDGLTGMLNRRALDEHLPQLLAAAESRQQPLSVLLIDFDHFKQVNDLHSHAVGDAVLREAAQLFSLGRAECDLLLRYGGEEFCLVLPGAGQSGAIRVAEQLRTRIADHDWEQVSPELEVTLSIGVAEYQAADNSEILLSRADLALYLAKRSGRDRVAVEPAQ
ncbi:GGDEF domain-containing protein [Chitiniphilus eburneus]|uniref:diguanylate cyclase n=1 Tax=Chitiniphilus eburneus TaxID=2571148 RepID=A0A4U0PXL9_9NEIS|nr:GGDEF domain-containing protein [Chitiniphilus eburneus]TJZ72990.1 diguanylate cyclase [Chitiniphilus eburneus]